MKEITNEIRSEVFNALDKVIFTTGATKEQLEEAVEWFIIHYFDEEGDEENV